MRADRGESELELAYVPAQIGEEPIAGQGFRRIVCPSRYARWADSVAVRGESHARPEGRGGVSQPKVDVAMLGQCGEDEQVVRIQSGGAEDREPFRKITGLRCEPQPGQPGLRAFGWARHTKLIAQSPPELGLPGTVGRQRRPPGVDVAPLRPTVD